MFDSWNWYKKCCFDIFIVPAGFFDLRTRRRRCCSQHYCLLVVSRVVFSSLFAPAIIVSCHSCTSWSSVAVTHRCPVAPTNCLFVVPPNVCVCAAESVSLDAAVTVPVRWRILTESARCWGSFGDLRTLHWRLDQRFHVRISITNNLL